MNLSECSEHGAPKIAWIVLLSAEVRQTFVLSRLSRLSRRVQIIMYHWEIMLFIGKPKGRSMMISNTINHYVPFSPQPPIVRLTSESQSTECKTFVLPLRGPGRPCKHHSHLAASLSLSPPPMPGYLWWHPKRMKDILRMSWVDILRNQLDTGWRRPTGRLKLQVIFCKRATNYRNLLRKMTCKDKASYHRFLYIFATLYLINCENGL